MLQIMFADSDLRLTGGTNPVFATICNTSPYLFEFSVLCLVNFFEFTDNMENKLTKHNTENQIMYNTNPTA
jgi:hypothetical protein